VDLLPLYETVRDDENAAAVRARFAAGEVDAVVFTSPSTVRHFLDLLPGVALEGVRVACIGPVTAAAARERGLAVAAVAPVQSARSLAGAVAAALQAPIPLSDRPAK
jgi:uroporphyrinogen III methyltransferase/synthase